MRCPAPILAVAKAAKATSGPSVLVVTATDGDFPTDVEAWCRSTGAELRSMEEADGTFVARIAVGGAEASGGSAEAAAPAPAAGAPANTQLDVDCSGMRCPAPILAVARAAKSVSGPTLMVVTATDGDFPTDIEAWCRSTRSELLGVSEDGGTFTAKIALGGHPGTITSPNPLAESAAPPPVDLDVSGDAPRMALMKIGQHSMQTDTFSFVAAPDPGLEKQLRAWASALGLGLEARIEGGRLWGEVLPEADAPVVEQAAPVASPVVADAMPGGFPRENKATLLVLHNDFEPLMAALMVANASAAQGMQVEIYFSFWGVNLLRGPRSTPVASTALEKPSILKRMMKRMMPAGPDRQQMSKMNFGGAGVGMMKYFMKQDNILGLRELMDQAADLDVKFVICTMSMGLMGISKNDLMDLPNIEFGGVTAFSSSARTSAMSMVF